MPHTRRDIVAHTHTQNNNKKIYTSVAWYNVSTLVKRARIAGGGSLRVSVVINSMLDARALNLDCP